MELLVASLKDAAGTNMARSLNDTLEADRILACDGFDLLAIDGPTIEADHLEDSLEKSYEGIVFLSKHAAVSGKLALTCHSTGNFAKAQFGGNDGQIAVPYTQLIRRHISALWERRSEFDGFDITLEATHHGPTGLKTPSAFVEVGTTDAQWEDADLCARVTSVLCEALKDKSTVPAAVCFGGNHYPSKFTAEVVNGRFATGTIVPKHALEHVDQEMMKQICEKNSDAKVALIDSKGMGPHKSRILELIAETGLEVVNL